MVNQNRSRSRISMTKSKNSQIEISKYVYSSSALRENKHLSSSRSKLSTKGSMAIFMHEKRDKGSVSNASLSSKRKSSHKSISVKNQSCQTIDPRRCDQLFYDGVIKYPSNKILLELAEIEKQKANRLDAHIKKEFFKRNKVKLKNPNKIPILSKGKNKDSEKGDGGGEEHPEEPEDEDEEEDEDNDNDDDDYEETENQNDKESVKNENAVNNSLVTSKQPKGSPPVLTMCAADIIRKTTENFSSPKKEILTDVHTPNNKGDSKVVKKLSKEEQEALKVPLDPNCPPGHIPLPDGDRKKTLHMLRVSHVELVREMNLLPVRTDTLRVRQRKMQLEAQLNKIEEGIKVFNKSKVYVKIEE